MRTSFNFTLIPTLFTPIYFIGNMVNLFNGIKTNCTLAYIPFFNASSKYKKPFTKGTNIFPYPWGNGHSNGGINNNFNVFVHNTTISKTKINVKKGL